MRELMLRISVDEDVKKQFDEFCNEIGTNTSDVINLFIRTVLKEKKIPFEVNIEKDNFYTDTNMKWLKKSIEQLESGKCFKHDLIEID